MTTALVPLAYYKTNYHQVRAGVTTFDAKMRSCVMVASAMIEDFCRRSFAYAARTDIITPHKNTQLEYSLASDMDQGLRENVSDETHYLNGIPVDLAAPFAVYYDPLRVFVPETTLVDPSFYTIDADTGELCSWFPTGKNKNSVRVSYSGGYPVITTTVDPTEVVPYLDPAFLPENLKMATCIQAYHLYNRTIQDNIGVAVERTDGDKAATPFAKTTGVLPEVSVLLKPYRRLLVGKQ